jgi:hypothetical protein
MKLYASSILLLSDETGRFKGTEPFNPVKLEALQRISFQKKIEIVFVLLSSFNHHVYFHDLHL